MQERRSDYDVTNTVQVSSPDAVREAVRALFSETYPAGSFRPLERAFDDFSRLFNGELPGYLGCDTVYHDIQHTLDITLAMARLVAGYERGRASPEQLGVDRAIIGLITSLFHDAGYIRRERDTLHKNGAEFTPYHVTRSAHFLRRYLPTIGWGDAAAVACQIVHFTGHEVNLDDLELPHPKDRIIGHLLGTADLIAQMADRCYLEKCRDRLYPEFVLGGLAIEQEPDGHTRVHFASGTDLLRQTPSFYEETTRKLLEGVFQRSYRFIETVFDGDNPYIEAIDSSLGHLDRVLASEQWQMLRRQPPCFTWEQGVLSGIDELVKERLQQLRLVN